MAKWITIVNSYDFSTEQVTVFLGDYIEAETREEAQKWCEENGKGYLFVTDQTLVSEVDFEQKDKKQKDDVFVFEYQICAN